MDSGRLQDYLQEDYGKALAFYDKRAVASKRWYRGLSIYLVVVSAGLTPMVAFAPHETIWRITASVLSATIVVATGLLAHLKCHENWLSYRSAWDALERERRYYSTGIGAYGSSETPAALFVERVEQIRSREGADFFARHAKRDEKLGKQRRSVVRDDETPRAEPC